LLAFVIDQVAYLIVGGGFIVASVLDQVHGGDSVPAALVPDTLTDLAGGACFNDARVQVALVPDA